jgi:hypothetical protein
MINEFAPAALEVAVVLPHPGTKATLSKSTPIK